MSFPSPADIQTMLDNATCLYDRTTIENAIDEMAKAISEKYHDKNPIVICVMTGGLHVMARLTLGLAFPVQLDYMHATRYQGKIEGGELEWKVPPRLSLENRHVIIVDDILDGGLTLASVKDYCEGKNAASVATAVMVDKDHTREPGGVEKADFTALNIPDKFIFGYGLDYEEYMRNVDGIYAVEG